MTQPTSAVPAGEMAQQPEHALRVHESHHSGLTHYWTSCACGWYGRAYLDHDAATDEGDRHLAEHAAPQPERDPAAGGREAQGYWSADARKCYFCGHRADEHRGRQRACPPPAPPPTFTAAPAPQVAEPSEEHHDLCVRRWRNGEWLCHRDCPLGGATPAQESALRETLRQHWLTAVDCDHEANTDTARCFCTVWTGTPQPSVGAAVEQWIDHVLAALNSQPGGSDAG